MDLKDEQELSPLEMLLRGALRDASIPLGTPPTEHPRYEAEADSPDYDNLLACIRCGACLPVCPTYNTDLLEVQSPRGRVQLIRQVEEGALQPSEIFASHMYHCLDCRACQSACPTGVRIGEQVLRARVQVERGKPRHIAKRLGLDFALGDQRRLEMLMLPVAIYQRIGLQWLVRKTRILHHLPKRMKLLAFMEELLPERIPLRSLRQRIAVVVPPQGEKRGRVGFFLGCVMSTVFAETSQATVRVLSENGYEVVTPKTQKCCGAPHAEEGDFESVKRFARENIALFERHDVDYIICDCAACGAQTKEYAELLHGDPQWAERAARFSAKVRDIMQFLSEIPMREPVGVLAARVNYHEACHLCHAQKVKKEPVERVLGALPGLEVVPLKESDWCCGSAGVYNLTHNERSMKILERKMDNIESTDADIVLAGNPGCLLQMDYGRRAHGSDKPVLHPVQVVDAAYRAGARVKGQGSRVRFAGVDGGEKLRTRRGRVVAVAADGKTRVSLQT